MANIQEYHKRLQTIFENARRMKEALVTPIMDPVSGEIIRNQNERSERLKAVLGHSIFESFGQGGNLIQRAGASAIHQYFARYGCFPNDEILASAYQAAENLLQLQNGAKVGGVFESADISTTEGILMRDRMVALILPVMLQTITANMVSFIPGTFNQSEIFKIDRIAQTTFGDLTKGDKIDYTFKGQYSSMDQRYLTGTGDGSDTGSSNEFDLNSNTKFGKIMPFKKKSIRVLHDRDIVAQDNGNGAIQGSFLVGVTTVTVTGTVDYANGIVHPVFSVAPANGIEIHVGIDIDIEKDATLIPLISHEMDSRTIYPHESAIGADVTLQALWAMRREYNIDTQNMALTFLRNLLAADRDRKQLADLRFYANGSESWDMTVPTSLYFQEHYETVKQTLLTIDSTLMSRTWVSGLVGIVADSKSSVVFKAMKEPNFVPASDYRAMPQPHYVGKLFGMWDLYEDPQAPTDYQCLCFGKGRDVGQSAYVSGDCIPPLSFQHNIQRDLVYKSTLWTLAYRDINPFDGRNYLINLLLTEGD